MPVNGCCDNNQGQPFCGSIGGHNMVNNAQQSILFHNAQQCERQQFGECKIPRRTSRECCSKPWPEYELDRPIELMQCSARLSLGGDIVRGPPKEQPQAQPGRGGGRGGFIVGPDESDLEKRVVPPGCRTPTFLSFKDDEGVRHEMNFLPEDARGVSDSLRRKEYLSLLTYRIR
ncbi:hypothetical protein Slin15195_G121710 [Septoria linicola]|uniref:Uncharacterized protein n=1 Tax=Septoria linicola TaxID=215465 RepID=A0A9Q9AZG7_9PEZI|nr:hypothetical protein Slin14017_G098700 [Septoria linicola]USW58852.1 hypothetical protein Slin15195_G121710 [Septoria linicola]